MYKLNSPCEVEERVPERSGRSREKTERNMGESKKVVA
jgi:hypothetical protein